jgi:NAD-dependent dihydropyrimidine dehydrogenase PreA subunit
MAGLFIDVKVAEQVAADPALAKKLVEVCPVNIFALGAGGTLTTVQDNLDECTLCELCLQAAPKGAVQVIKLYES